jgi:hypothetical protein
MTEERRRARVEWVALAAAATFLGFAIFGLAEAAAYLSRLHAEWAEGLHELLQDVAWAPLMFGAWRIKVTVQDWLNGA